MRRMTLLLALLSLGFAHGLKAQITDVYAGNDTIELRLGNYQYGFIQWQVSQDTVNWENIEGATDTVYRFLPSKNAYYRALASFENCPNVTSRVCYVQVPPKADAGPDRKLMEGDGATMFALLEEGCVGEWEIIEGQGGELSNVHDPNAYFIGTSESYKLKWTVTNACGSVSDTLSISYHRTVVNQDVVVIDTTDVILSDSTQLVNGLYIVSFSDPQPNIGENSIIVGVRENSFLRKVVSHEVDGDIHYIETVEATLDDILLEGVLSMDFRSYLSGRGNKRVIKNRFPTRKELMENKEDCVYIMMPRQEDENGAKITFNYREGDEGTLSWKVGWFKLPGEARIMPTLTLNPNFIWELDRTFLHVHHFKFGLYNSYLQKEARLELPGDVTVSAPLNTIDLPTVPSFFIWLPVAGVPVKFSVDITASVRQTASYTIGPRMSYTMIERTTLSSYIEYNENSEWNANFSLSKRNDHTSERPDYGNFSYELSVGPKFSFLVYDCIGPYVSLKLYGKVKGRFDGPHNQATNLTIGAKKEIGAQLKFCEHVVLDYSYPLVDAKVFEVDDPFFMEVYSGNNQSYTPGEWLLDDIKVKVYNSRGNVSGSTKVRFETSDGFLSNEYATTGPYDGIAKVRWRAAPSATGEITLKAYLYNLKDEPLQCVPVVIHAYQGASVPSCANSTLSVRAELVNGSIKLVANGGKTPYVFSTDGLSFSPTIPLVIPVEGTTYHFYVRDALNCVKDCYYTHPTFNCLTSDLDLTLSRSGNTVTANATGGMSPYQYCLDNGSYGSTYVFQNLMNGRHVVYVRDANGCEEAEVITIEADGGGSTGGGTGTGGGSVTVTTSPTVNILEPTMATGGGSVSITGNATVVRKGICWSRNHAPTTNGDYYTSSSSSNTFSGCPMANLTPNVIYYMRAFAVTNTGTVYGNEVGFSTTAVAPVVTTTGVGNITTTTARVYGNVSNINGTTVTECGVCWSTGHNPTIAGSHLACGSGTGAFTADITNLISGMRYYVRAYATNNMGTSYGEEKEFTTNGNGGGTHEYIDLGLPSGTLWATCNVGANSPEENGGFFAWGETIPKMDIDDCNWSDYQHCNGSYNTLTRYCNDPEYGFNGFTDDLTILLPEDDVATVYWGAGWRMPTKSEWVELRDNTEINYTTLNGVSVAQFTASNGNSIILPYNNFLINYSLGHYWSSSLKTDEVDESWAFWFPSTPRLDVQMIDFLRVACLNVRPIVRSNNFPQVTTSEVSHSTNSTATCGGVVVSGGGSIVVERGVCWSTNHNPTLNDHHSYAGMGEGNFKIGATGLSPATTYYVRAYATNSAGTTYGNEVQFTTLGNNSGNYDYVDLGLPSGTLWATCNVGADIPENSGDYFAWGEISTKDCYDWNTYQYCVGGNSFQMSKYSDSDSHTNGTWNYGYTDFTDDLKILLPEDDAATVNWGEDWRMPTKEEWEELFQHTTYTQVNDGVTLTAANGNSIFLPIVGYYDGCELGWMNMYGKYWSSTHRTEYSDDAWCLDPRNGNYYDLFSFRRIVGCSVRAVRSSRQD